MHIAHRTLQVAHQSHYPLLVDLYIHIYCMSEKHVSVCERTNFPVEFSHQFCWLSLLLRRHSYTFKLQYCGGRFTANSNTSHPAKRECFLENFPKIKPKISAIEFKCPQIVDTRVFFSAQYSTFEQKRRSRISILVGHIFGHEAFAIFLLSTFVRFN